MQFEHWRDNVVYQIVERYEFAEHLMNANEQSRKNQQKRIRSDNGVKYDLLRYDLKIQQKISSNFCNIRIVRTNEQRNRHQTFLSFLFCCITVLIFLHPSSVERTE